jgi:transposase InsO family protein
VCLSLHVIWRNHSQVYWLCREDPEVSAREGSEDDEDAGFYWRSLRPNIVWLSSALIQATYTSNTIRSIAPDHLLFRCFSTASLPLSSLHIVNLWLFTTMLSLRESFTCIPLRNLLVTCMPWKSSQARVCHALEVRWRTCHFGWMKS